MKKPQGSTTRCEGSTEGRPDALLRAPVRAKPTGVGEATDTPNAQCATGAQASKGERAGATTRDYLIMTTEPCGTCAAL